MASMSKINKLIVSSLKDQPPAVRSICEDIVASARDLHEKALEARLEELIRKAVKRGEDKR